MSPGSDIHERMERCEKQLTGTFSVFKATRRWMRKNGGTIVNIVQIFETVCP